MNKNDYIINEIDPFSMELDIQESQFQSFFKWYNIIISFILSLRYMRIKTIKNFSQESFFLLFDTVFICKKYSNAHQFYSIFTLRILHFLCLFFPFIYLSLVNYRFASTDTHKGCRSVKTIRWCNNREIER